MGFCEEVAQTAWIREGHGQTSAATRCPLRCNWPLLSPYPSAFPWLFLLKSPRSLPLPTFGCSKEPLPWTPGDGCPPQSLSLRFPWGVQVGARISQGLLGLLQLPRWLQAPCVLQMGRLQRWLWGGAGQEIIWVHLTIDPVRFFGCVQHGFFYHKT